MSDSNNYYALMSENNSHGIFNEIELVKYYARKISLFCKDHRCATCPFCVQGKMCEFLNDSPDQWKGIKNHENND